MNPRRQGFFLVALLTVLGGALALGWWDARRLNPILERRPLAAWVAELTDANRNRQARAAGVLHTHSVTALPGLSHRLEAQPPQWRQWLARLGNRFLPGRFTEGNDRATRSAVAVLLGSLGPPARDAVPALLRAAGDEHWEVRENSAVALIRLGPDAAPVLADILATNPERKLALRAAEILERMNASATVALPKLLTAYRRSTPEVKIALARVLGQEWAAGESVNALLLEAAAPAEEAVAAAALGALAAHGPPDERTLAVLERGLQSPSRLIRFRAATTLFRTTGETANTVAIIAEAVGDEALRVEAVAALGQIGAGAQPAIPTLIAALKRERNPRPLRMPPAAGLALSRIRGPALDEVLRLLESPEAAVRLNAVVTISLFGSHAREAGPILQSRLRDPSVDVRHAAALGLASVGFHHRDAIPVLQDILRDDDPFMVTWAGDALAKIDPTLVPVGYAR
jgi:HEAT repeat protein